MKLFTKIKDLGGKIDSPIHPATAEKAGKITRKKRRAKNVAFKKYMSQYLDGSGRFKPGTDLESINKLFGVSAVATQYQAIHAEYIPAYLERIAEMLLGGGKVMGRPKKRWAYMVVATTDQCEDVEHALSLTELPFTKIEV